MTARRTDTDVEGGDAFVLRNLSGSSGSLHRSIRRSLKTISLDMLTPSAPRDSLGPSKVGYVNHSIVEAGIDMGDTPVIYSLGLLCHANTRGTIGAYAANLNY